MKKHIIKRSGAEDLIFYGELLGSAAERPMGCQERLKWTEVDIYKTENNSYIVTISSQALWQEEEKVLTFEDASGVVSALGAHNWSLENDNLGRTVKRALDEAAEKDDRLSAVQEK